MSEPIQTCRNCGRVQVVTPDGRGHPPDIARRKLTRACNADGCACDPRYTAGMSAEIAAIATAWAERKAAADEMSRLGAEIEGDNR